jgi:hypothetical protein
MPATPTVNPTKAALEAAVLDLTDTQIADALRKVDPAVRAAFKDRASRQRAKQPGCPGGWQTGYSARMRGDKVEILVDTGNGVRGFEVAATRSGRRVEVSTVRNMVEVAEVTRTGQPVRSARFLASRVVAIVEHPADDRR